MKKVKLEELERYRLLFLVERQSRMKTQMQQLQTAFQETEKETAEAIDAINQRYGITEGIEVRMDLESGMLLWPEDYVEEEQ